MKPGSLYEPIKYWAERENPNNPAGETAERVAADCAYLRKMVGGEKQIFELGPGIGRTLSAYNSGTSLTSLDISRNYSERLDKVAAQQGILLHQNYIEETHAPFPFKDDEFPIGVCFQVFIHQPPEIFTHSFSEFVRVSKKVIISVGIHRNLGIEEPKRRPHVFAHDYLAAAHANRCEINNLILRDGCMYFTARKIG
jgi:hypothetical protein